MATTAKRRAMGEQHGAKRLRAVHARRNALPAYEPQLATLVESAPEGDFIHELKYDGFTYFVFDLLHLDGRDLRGEPLRARKAELARLLARAPARVKYAEHVDAQGARTFARACALGAEGIVSKRANGVHHPGRSSDWQKVIDLLSVLRESLARDQKRAPAKATRTRGKRVKAQ